MYNVNDLVAALQSGKTMDQLAAEMTAALNAAQVEAQRQEEAKREEAAKAALVEAKRQAAAKVFGALGAYLEAFHKDSTLAQMYTTSTVGTEDLDKLVGQLDETVELFSALGELAEAFGNTNPFGVAPSTMAPPKAVKAGTDPLEDFLNQFVR
jgi:chemotaxis protein histidine kinase CheA